MFPQLMSAEKKKGLLSETPYKMGETLYGTTGLDIYEEKRLIEDKLIELKAEGATDKEISCPVFSEIPTIIGLFGYGVFAAVDSKPGMEEIILVSDDLMMRLPSPIIPPEIASHVLEGVELSDEILRNIFLCLQMHDIEPFCQDEIALYRQCARKRDRMLRQQLQNCKPKLGVSMPIDEAKQRAAQLQAEAASLGRRLILASGIQGTEGFHQRWSLHGRLMDTN
ncbi:hypothetical protein MLD38_004074 [Melastoma candidum]|uniref:Uncharacterized protein n=1 Tax=Melastoma candidum TaxID=119954 RepID=A0ACB9S498_9MYRT|nr:hypothetical protein MLD38_004074 [Melastoma candidum]